MDSNKRMSLGYGFLLLSLGALWLMHAMAILPWYISDYVLSWRFLLVIIGLFMIVKKPRGILGLVVLATGLVASVASFWVLPEGWKDFLPPVVLIAVGLVLILRPNPNRKKASADDANSLNRATVFGSFKHQVTSVLFKGGFLSSVFGSNFIDFTNAHLGNDNVALQCTNVFGNSVLVVPQGWDVKLEVNNIFGSTEDKRDIETTPSFKEGVLTVTGFTLFGKVEILN